MATSSHDDAFHEIQLNGKQLFFLFMAATVVSVVIFLCGVLVGRGVRAERGVAELDAVNTSPSADALPAGTSNGTGSTGSTGSTAGADPTIVPPPPPAEEILEVNPRAPVAEPGKTAKKAPEEAKPAATGAPAVTKKPSKADKPGASTDKSAAADKQAAVVPPSMPPMPPMPTTGATKPPVPGALGAAPPTAASMPAPGPATSSAPASDTYAVQVAALNKRGDADAFAKNLTSKGYSAYVVPPERGETVYRVRVGAYTNRGDANAMADKLHKEMNLKPFVSH